MPTLADLRARLLGAWRTTLAGLGIAAALVWLHHLGADGIRALTGEVSALGDLLAALAGTMGAVPASAAAALVWWRGRA